MSITLQNPHLSKLEVDFLYHLGLDTTMPLKEMFGDTKFVCMGGSADRSKRFAAVLSKELNLPDANLDPIGKTERYSMYKVGPVISVNHGMGMPSHSILMHEITKLLYYAGATDVTFIRIGTCGGVGVAAATVAITTEAVNSELKCAHRAVVLGKVIEYPTIMDPTLVQLAVDAAKGGDGEEAIPCVSGRTLGTDDFYEGQGRLDGAICEFDDAAQAAWVASVQAAGVVNIEMESAQFAAFCNRLGLRAILLCGVLLNRLDGDQIKSSPAQLRKAASNVFVVTIRIIKRSLGINTPTHEIDE